MSTEATTGKTQTAPTSPPIGSNMENLKNNFVSIEYPGRVVNDQEAFRTMGGLDGISAVHSKENRKYQYLILEICTIANKYIDNF